MLAYQVEERWFCLNQPRLGDPGEKRGRLNCNVVVVCWIRTGEIRVQIPTHFEAPSVLATFNWLLRIREGRKEHLRYPELSGDPGRFKNLRNK